MIREDEYGLGNSSISGKAAGEGLKARTLSRGLTRISNTMILACKASSCGVSH
jgi:hypothetical protein